MRAIAEGDYGWRPADWTPGRDRRRLTRESTCRSLAAADFDLEVTDVSHLASAEAQRAWLSIPIFTKDPLVGLRYEDRMRVLHKAYDRLRPGRTEVAHWIVFLARAKDPE